MKKKKGFTLIEIIIVIALLSVIGVGSTVVILKVRDKHEVDTLVENQDKFQNALDVYLSNHEEVVNNIKNNANGAVISLEVLKNEGLIPGDLKINYKDNYYTVTHALLTKEELEDGEVKDNCKKTDLTSIASWVTSADAFKDTKVYFCPKEDDCNSCSNFINNNLESLLSSTIDVDCSEQLELTDIDNLFSEKNLDTTMFFCPRESCDFCSTEAYPTLLANNGWFMKSGVSNIRSKTTTISFEKGYVQKENVTYVGDPWNVDKLESGEIKAYLEIKEDGNYKAIITSSADKIYANTDSSNLFAAFEELEEIENIDMLDTSNVTTMDSMFATTKKLKSLDLSSWNTKSLTDIDSMFIDSGIESLKTFSFNDYSREVTTEHTFEGCKNLTKLDLSAWKIAPKLMRHMFYECSSLQELDISNISTCKLISENNKAPVYGNITGGASMFGYVVNLSKIRVSSIFVFAGAENNYGNSLPLGNWFDESCTWIELHDGYSDEYKSACRTLTEEGIVDSYSRTLKPYGTDGCLTPQCTKRLCEAEKNQTSNQ